MALTSPAADPGVDTHLYRLSRREVSLPFLALYGAMDNFSEGVIVSDDNGALYSVLEGGQPQRWPIRIPIPTEEFRKAVGDRVQLEWFSVKGLRVVEKPGHLLLLASYHHWNPEQRCVTLRLSQLRIPKPIDPEQPGAENWELVFETSPCLPLKSRGHPFAGAQAGGRVEPLSDSEILFSVGDHQYDGINGENFPQDMQSSYGKIIRINLDTKKSDLFSIGHRNPQGLRVDDQGNVWATEHGPRGGDELNLIVNGGNYGWPGCTAGTDYEGHTRRAPPGGCDTVSTIEPKLTWIPAIAPSQLAIIRGDRLDRWRGNLVIGSLRAANLVRVVLENDIIRHFENIYIGERVRDISEDRHGRLVLLLPGKLLFLEPQPE